MATSADGGGGLTAGRPCRLTNTTYWDAVASVPLASLPIFCGAPEHDLRLFDDQARPVDRPEVLAQAGKIADLLRDTDVSYLTLRNDVGPSAKICTEPLILYSEVLKFNSEAFEYCIPGLIDEQMCHDSTQDRKPSEFTLPIGHAQTLNEKVFMGHSDGHALNVTPPPLPSRKLRGSMRGGHELKSTNIEDSPHKGVALRNFCEMLEDFCSRAEGTNDEVDEEDGSPLHLADIKQLLNKIISFREKKLLHLVPVEDLVRLLNILDRQIQLGQVLSIDENESPNSDVLAMIMCALEATHTSLVMMTHHEMPKQLYKEEMIERIVDCSRHHIMECMLICDPSYRALHKPKESGSSNGEDEELVDPEVGSASKRRCSSKSSKVKKSTGNKISSAVHSVLQKLCSIVGLLKDLLLIERLPDSCILQLVKTSFTTFTVENFQILQLKSMSLISGVFTSYMQHRNFVIDELFQLLWKLPFSKRTLRAYHLPDEEQQQIQMITAMLIQLIQSNPNLHEVIGKNFGSSSGFDLSVDTNSSGFDLSVDTNYPTKCYEAGTEASCLFWTRVVQRFTTAKTQNQDISELKVTIENLVADLLTTLNLPEYPASALILEVLCVLLLQNAGLKSKDIAARCFAIDLLGTIAARLKRDSVVSKRNRFWMLEDSQDNTAGVNSNQMILCVVCGEAQSHRHLIICQSCERRFHAECSSLPLQEDLQNSWLCQLCLCKRQLVALTSYCNSLHCDSLKNEESCKEESAGISKVEVVQQLLLNYLQESSSSDDAYLFACWFYLCQWYKDDPKSKDKFMYYLVRLKSKAIVRDFGTVSSLLTRASAKRLSLALGQDNSFARGFDKILYILLASLRENSPILRAKALRAVSVIVEADPEALCEKNVQAAVEGRFCDSAISVREAALELVGRHISSHPEVGVKYFEKVAERMKDTGVSVRKRAIRIIRDMCTSTPDFPEFTSACIEIISRVNDDEASIQDLVCKTFYEFWFEESSRVQTQFYGSSSLIPLEIAKKTEQIVDMLRKLPNHQFLMIVIRRNLLLDFIPQSAKAFGMNAIASTSVRRRCELMCKCLLEKILEVEEMTNKETEVRALPYVLALYAFCTVDATLCAPAADPSQFVVTLQPYLKSQIDNRAVAQLLESIVFVIDSVLPLRRPPQGVIEELEQDLKHMIYRHSFLTVVHSCIRCLCSLNKVAGRDANVVKSLIQVFFKHLSSLGSDNKQQVGRSLFCLGLLIRYGSELMASTCSETVLNKCISLLKNFLDIGDFCIKLRALQALGHVLIAKPDFMLNEDIGNIVENALSSESDSMLKMQALQNLNEYLLDMENKMGTSDISKGKASYSEVAGYKVSVAAGAGDSNNCGGIIQLYWNSILDRCMDMNEQVRQSAIKIVEVVLRQGLVHPMTSVPYLIALENDPEETNSKLAHQLLMNMNEKYPAFFESRLGDGLQMSFSFIKSLIKQNKLPSSIKGISHGGIFAYAKNGVSKIYRLIRGNRASRNKFMFSVIQKFNLGSCSESLIPFLMYCTEILAALPFTTPDEPLYVIYNINRVIQVRAGVVESEMKIHSSHQGRVAKILQENGSTLSETETQISSENIVLCALNANRLAAGDSCAISKDDLTKFQDNCHAAIALQLLLKLKRYLKIMYGLNDARCQAYSPNDPLKHGEPLSKQSLPFNVNEPPINLPSTYEEMAIKYQEFKASLKEDTVDYTIYSSSVKRRRPPAKGGRPSIGVDDEEFDDDDENWSGGRSRQLGGGGRRSFGRSRQRL